jgi:hypothetical protein
MPVSASIPPSANTPALWARRENATKHIQELMRTVLRGPSKDVFKLSKPLKSSADAAFNDRFVLSVQLGSGAVQWTLMLDGMRPERAPDIIFDEASEDFSTTIQYAELEAIKKWDIKRETALLELLQELHGKFLKHHHERVQTFSEAHVKFELESIIAHAPHAQMRFVNDKDRTVECVIPMYHGPEMAAAAAARSSLSASAAPGAECELCRLVLVMDQAMKLVQGSLHYPASTPPTQVKPRLRRAGGETRGLSSLVHAQRFVTRKQLPGEQEASEEAGYRRWACGTLRSCGACPLLNAKLGDMAVLGRVSLGLRWWCVQRAECPRWIPGETHAFDLLPMVQVRHKNAHACPCMRAGADGRSMQGRNLIEEDSWGAAVVRQRVRALKI